MSNKFKKNAGITFSTVNSNFYRALHADGVHCIVKPPTFVHLVFFNERPSIPSQFTRSILPDKSLGDDIDGTRVAKTDWTRELEVDVVLTNELAVKLYHHLGKQLNIKDITPSRASEPTPE